MEKAPVPYPPVLHSLASSSAVAWLIHQKFELGIPLYRQEKEWKALGLDLSRATMSDWLLAVYRDWLQHVVGRLKQELLGQDYLHIDETRVQVLKEPGRKIYPILICGCTAASKMRQNQSITSNTSRAGEENIRKHSFRDITDTSTPMRIPDTTE